VNPSIDGSEGPYLDFRDLLLSGDEALEYGGGGMQRYGNLTRSVKTVLDDQLFAENTDTGRPFINEVLGMISTTGVFFSYSRNVAIDNLDVQVDANCRTWFWRMSTPFTIILNY
jgi:hypothetical protein